MSLIQFHIFLIAVSIIFGFGFGLWEAVHYGSSQLKIDLLTAAGSFAAALLLAAYLIWFLRRLKRRPSY